jgi:hypothetical protein
MIKEHKIYKASEWATQTNQTKPKKTEYKFEELTLMNYKEPLMSVKNGYGYYGAVTGTIDGQFVQCHICGHLFMNLGAHIWLKHKMRGREYKEEFGLAYSTALLSEAERGRLKQRTLDWLKNTTDEQRERFARKLDRNRRKWIEEHRDDDRTQPELQLETKNKRGTCPDQLLAKIIEVKENLGRTPSKDEFITACKSQRYIHLIYKVFGSWKEALSILGLQPKKEEKGGFRRYEDEELLEYLRSYAETEKKIPTQSDFRRHLLPTYGVYTRRFGSIENARVEAGVYNYVEEQ